MVFAAHTLTCNGVPVLGPQLPSSDYGLMLADGRDRDTAWQRVAEAIGV